MPGWNLVVVVVVTTVLSRLLFIPFDRRRKWRAGKALTPPGTGNCAASQVVDLDLPSDRVDEVVLTALHRCRVKREARQPPEGWRLGYSGFNWKTGTWGTEFAVGITQLAEGSVRLWCYTRPRSAVGVVDFGVSRRAADRLTRALREAAEMAVRPCSRPSPRPSR
jgi:hypothetical protein